MAPKKHTTSTPEVMARDCIAVRLRALNRAVSALYDDALRPHGLRIGQANILVAVARMGTARPGEVCRILRMEKSTLSRDVEVMRRNGWLEVSEEAGGRTRPLRLTPGGRAVLDNVFPAWKQAQRKAKTLLGDEVVDAIAKVSLVRQAEPAVTI
jgi:DNA-binding MarR family transcriptional regulator